MLLKYAERFKTKVVIVTRSRNRYRVGLRRKWTGAVRTRR
jgi:hypothetical protein